MGIVWSLSMGPFWDSFGTASRARFRRISRKIHGPPPLRTPRFPDGLPGLAGVHAVKLRAANRLYSYMRKLIKQLHAANVVWTVENPFTSLLWETSYWKDIAEVTAPFYCELHNCMFWWGTVETHMLGIQFQRSDVLSIFCAMDPMNTRLGPLIMGFLTQVLEAEYTPTFAKAIGYCHTRAYCPRIQNS